MRKKERALQIFERLQQEYGEVICTLDAKDNPWELLVAAILAAQCTDARVNLVTPALFAAFPHMEDFAKAEAEAVVPYIASCGFYRNKSRSIVEAARYLLREHGGEVPQTLEALLAVPGVGRKIANLLLGECFAQQAVVVDTHCLRLSRRLGLSKEKDPKKVEFDLVKILPSYSWTDWGHYMVEHGRAVCKARAADCAHCVVQSLCQTGKQWAKRQEKLKNLQEQKAEADWLLSMEKAQL